ncbi:uncharacterized protein LOC121370023 [Gigantopelta aegis]|uniref:uncharacterized protein LOC121370023 n=1 Tax=Gigantopelta aegis TaxID=1735272 RepID=UPI001B88C68C|nr:uncharacterized protein LOC121370023 [Gigantopelta aegis]
MGVMVMSTLDGGVAFGSFLQNYGVLEDGTCLTLEPDCNMTKGCQTACSFFTGPFVDNDKTNVTWHFGNKVKLKASSYYTDITWSVPVPDSIVPGPVYFVYVLLVRDRNFYPGTEPQPWVLLGERVATKLSVDTDKVPYYPEFLLFAISENGIAAQTNFSAIESDIFGPAIGIPESDLLRELPPGVFIADPGPMNITVDTHIVNQTVAATLKWRHPDAPNLECSESNQDQCFYNIDWFMMNCNGYIGVPDCNRPPDHFAETQHFKFEHEPSFDLPELLFNSEYRILIETRDKKNNLFMSDLRFKTPKCMDTGKNFKKCHDPVESTTENPDQTDFSGTTESIREVHALSIESQPMTYNAKLQRLELNMTWSTPLNQSALNFYQVRWEMQTGSPDNRILTEVGLEKTNKSHMVLTLEKDSSYYIVVEAHFNSSKTNGLIFQSESIEVNTTNWSSNSTAAFIAQPITQHKKAHFTTVSGIIIGVTVVISLIILALIILFIYKKRKNFKDIIIPRTTVSKSNSYKSNMGGKSDYSNQLLVVSDEWELDPKLIKFSTPLGQGAFGKVVTGYYSDSKVAIKLIKEGAPMSYKEDLVAEINLMKRIGSHPNIVSMIGACTLFEPIALVMEFVPYGNLQSFLKRCRMEGDLCKRPDGPSEITYSMLLDTGGIENGIITPADMLSFARQVSMAMQYLADKRYVHRDLAARNVLLDCNKVVKVCDFGLSRDIYNDNEYKKLTNGKLPLKWMAIESLRDRVFTTQTDVWSFGILLWEIVTMGASPYPNIALADLYYVLINGYRMDKPSNCSDELYFIMRKCWEERPQERPCFTQLRLMVEELLTQDRDYLVLENIDAPLNTSENSSTPIDSSSHSGVSSGLAAAAQANRDSLRVNVCVHGKSTDRLLLRRSESDSSP